MDTKVCEIIDMKVVEEDKKHYMTGYANTKNHADSYGDIPTNYNDEDVYVLERMNSNPVCFVDHRSSATNIAGNFVELREDDKGLFFKLLFRQLSDIYNPALKDAVASYITGFGRALSIGGSWLFGDPKNPNHLTKAILSEISLVGIGSDMDALSSTTRPKHFKSILPFADLPIAKKDSPWNFEDTATSLKHLSDEEFSKAFLWKGKIDNVETHQFPVADFVEGELKIIPKALFSAAASLSGAKGGIDLPDDEKDGVKYQIDKYYKKMDIESPFEKNVFRIDHLTLDDRLLENLLKTGVKFNNKMAKALVSSIKSNLQCDVVYQDQRDAETWKNVTETLTKMML